MEAEPLYISVRKMRVGVEEINSALSEYAHFLNVLASIVDANEEVLNEIAQKTNQNLRSGLAALDQDLADRDVAIFSAVGVEAMRQIIRKNQRQAIREVMTDAKDPLAVTSKAVGQATRILALNVQETYQVWAASQTVAYNKAESDAERRKIVVETLDHNDQVTALLELINSLRDGYAKIDEAHDQLLTSLDDEGSLQDRIQAIYADAQRLQHLQRRLEKQSSDK